MGTGRSVFFRPLPHRVEKDAKGDAVTTAEVHSVKQTPNNNSLSALVLMPIFPKLTSLLLEKLDFTHVVPGSGVLYDLILNAVKRRRAKKPLVSAMCITRCAISAEEAVALEVIVRDFWWSYDKCIDIDLDEDDDGD